MKNLFHDQHSCQKCGGFVDLTHYELDEDWEQCEVCQRKPVICKCSYCPREICETCEIPCDHPMCVDHETKRSLYSACKKCYTDHKKKIHKDVPTPEKEAAGVYAARLKKKRADFRFAAPCEIYVNRASWKAIQCIVRDMHSTLGGTGVNGVMQKDDGTHDLTQNNTKIPTTYQKQISGIRQKLTYEPTMKGAKMIRNEKDPRKYQKERDRKNAQNYPRNPNEIPPLPKAKKMRGIEYTSLYHETRETHRK